MYKTVIKSNKNIIIQIIKEILRVRQDALAVNQPRLLACGREIAFTCLIVTIKLSGL